MVERAPEARSLDSTLVRPKKLQKNYFFGTCVFFWRPVFRRAPGMYTPLNHVENFCVFWVLSFGRRAFAGFRGFVICSLQPIAALRTAVVAVYELNFKVMGDGVTCRLRVFFSST